MEAEGRASIEDLVRAALVLRCDEGISSLFHVAVGADGSLSAGDELAVTGAESASEEWIVKFAAANDPADIGPLEEVYARMARDAQIEMAETRLIPWATGPGNFATRRFDRPVPGKRLHLVSLGGALEASPHLPGVASDGFLKATLAITHSMADVEQAFRRMVFNVLSRNRDDHVRQHAYLMDDRGGWRRAPAFDLTFSNGPGREHFMTFLWAKGEPSPASMSRGSVVSLPNALQLPLMTFGRHSAIGRRMRVMLESVPLLRPCRKAWTLWLESLADACFVQLTRHCPAGDGTDPDHERVGSAEGHQANGSYSQMTFSGSPSNSSAGMTRYP